MVRNYQNADCSLKNKFTALFIIISGTLSFPIATLPARAARQLPQRRTWVGSTHGLGQPMGGWVGSGCDRPSYRARSGNRSCPSVRLFLLQSLNRLTFDLHLYTSMSHDHDSSGIESGGYKPRSRGHVTCRVAR